MNSSRQSAANVWPITDDAVRDAVQQMLADGSWGRYHGPHCEALQQALQTFHETEHVQLCCSGTSAIELALRAVNVTPGDEVILAAYDYKANFANVLALGARPVLIDTLPGRPVPDPGQLLSAVSSSTKAIICSHLHGCLAPLDDICALAAERGLSVIEDACQVPGARLGTRRAGAGADIGVLSFGGSKLLTAGRGGAVLTSNARLAQRIRLYTQRGNDAYPLSEMQAAVLLPQLGLLDSRNRQRQASVQFLSEQLSADSSFQLIDDATAMNSTAWYKVPFLWNDERLTSRDALEAACESLPLDPGFPALHLIHAASRFRSVGDLPHATELHRRLLTLHHPILLAENSALLELAQCLNDQ